MRRTRAAISRRSSLTTRCRGIRLREVTCWYSRAVRAPARKRVATHADAVCGGGRRRPRRRRGHVDAVARCDPGAEPVASSPRRDTILARKRGYVTPRCDCDFPRRQIPLRLAHRSWPASRAGPRAVERRREALQSSVHRSARQLRGACHRRRRAGAELADGCVGAAGARVRLWMSVGLIPLF